MRFVAFGRTQMIYNSIKALIEHGHEVALIGTCSPAPEYLIKSKGFQELAENYGVPFFSSANINSDHIVHMLKSAAAEVAVSVNWLTVVRNEVCSIFLHGVLNAHAGDLPRYQGNAPLCYAILNNEKTLGICIHKMEPERLDSGPILVKRHVPIEAETTIGELLTVCDNLVPVMFVEALNGLENGSMKPKPQPEDPELSLRCYPRRPEDGLIVWSQSAEHIARLVRATTQPYKGAYTFLEGRRVRIWKAHAESILLPSMGTPGQVIERRENGDLAVLTGNGLLIIEQASSENGLITKPTSFVQSLRQRMGMSLEDEVYELKRMLAALERKFMSFIDEAAD